MDEGRRAEPPCPHPGCAGAGGGLHGSQQEAQSGALEFGVVLHRKWRSRFGIILRSPSFCSHVLTLQSSSATVCSVRIRLKRANGIFSFSANCRRVRSVTPNSPLPSLASPSSFRSPPSSSVRPAGGWTGTTKSRSAARWRVGSVGLTIFDLLFVSSQGRSEKVSAFFTERNG